MNERPLSVTVIAWIYIAVGVIGVVYHTVQFKARHPFPYDFIWIELVSVLAIVCGVYMLRGYNWARWAAVAWIGFHVVLSAFHSLSQFAIHVLFCAIIAYSLFRPAATRYFHRVR